MNVYVSIVKRCVGSRLSWRFHTFQRKCNWGQPNCVAIFSGAVAFDGWLIYYIWLRLTDSLLWRMCISKTKFLESERLMFWIKTEDNLPDLAVMPRYLKGIEYKWQRMIQLIAQIFDKENIEKTSPYLVQLKNLIEFGFVTSNTYSLW